MIVASVFGGLNHLPEANLNAVSARIGTSAFGAKPETVCSIRALRVLTRCMVRPCVARGFRRVGGGRSCINVSGLWLELVGLRAAMEFSARAISLPDRPQRAIRVTSVHKRREDRSSISSDPLADLGGKSGYVSVAPSCADRSSRRGGRLGNLGCLEAAAMGENGPCDARQLVGKRDRQHIAVQPPLGRLDPGFEPVALPVLRPDQDHPGGLSEQDAQVAIAALGYLAKDGAASRRELFGDKTQPGGEVAALGERISGTDGRYRRAGDDRPDAGHAHQPLAAAIPARKRFDLT